MNDEIQELINTHEWQLNKSDRKELKRRVKIDKLINKEMVSINKYLDFLKSIKLENQIKILGVFGRIDIDSETDY